MDRAAAPEPIRVPTVDATSAYVPDQPKALLTTSFHGNLTHGQSSLKSTTGQSGHAAFECPVATVRPADLTILGGFGPAGDSLATPAGPSSGLPVGSPSPGNTLITTPSSKSASSPDTATGPPYCCTYCGKHFSRRRDLERRHLPIHDPSAKRFPCPFLGCDRKADRGFLRLDKLAEHRRSKGH
ncbi:hypothetical protein QQS21_003941 [Conoideocrella luteorostrata]|uniref:C2H2-type domain-containing protein n=1 Tax=Conoideocrella luteorostrata TaxID=1105319 RepID=A0AAJ0CSD7_9HYPO|nr:hypothetical protein QQS21_003941 [Conoideocrella luteorostrata]